MLVAVATITDCKQFIGVKPVGPQQAQLHIDSVQNLWAELQEFLFKKRESTSMLPLQAISSDASSAVADCEREDGLVDTLDRRRTQLNGINEQIRVGNLANAWISIPPLMRAMEIWESKSLIRTSNDNHLIPAYQFRMRKISIKMLTAFITKLPRYTVDS